MSSTVTNQSWPSPPHDWKAQHKYPVGLWSLHPCQCLNLLQSSGEIVDYIPGQSGCAIEVTHRHYKQAIKALECFSVPSTPKEFARLYGFKQWDFVAERILLAVKL